MWREERSIRRLASGLDQPALEETLHAVLRGSSPPFIGDVREWEPGHVHDQSTMGVCPRSARVPQVPSPECSRKRSPIQCARTQKAGAGYCRYASHKELQDLPAKDSALSSSMSANTTTAAAVLGQNVVYLARAICTRVVTMVHDGSHVLFLRLTPRDIQLPIVQRDQVSLVSSDHVLRPGNSRSKCTNRQICKAASRICSYGRGLRFFHMWRMGFIKCICSTLPGLTLHSSKYISWA